MAGRKALLEILDRISPPWVIKYESYSLGKGVVVVTEREKAVKAIERTLKGPEDSVSIEAYRP